MKSFLADLERLTPSREQRDSIARGLETVVRHVGGDVTLVDKVRRLSAG